LLLSIVSCIGVVWETYSIPNDWIVGNELLRHILGLVRFMFTFTDLLLTISFSIAPDWFTHLGKHGILRSTWRVWLVSR
jgi:hypothetical protein